MPASEVNEEEVLCVLPGGQVTEAPRADGGISAAGAVGVAGFIYKVGGDLIPRLKTQKPLLVSIIQSVRSTAEPISHSVEITVKNQTLHGVYVERLIMRWPTDAQVHQTKNMPIGWNKPSALSSGRILAGDAPWYIAPLGSIDLAIIFSETALVAGHAKKDSGAFRIVFSQLHETETLTTSDIHFRVRIPA